MHFDGTIIITDPCYISGFVPETKSAQIHDLYYEAAPTIRRRRTGDMEHLESLINMHKEMLEILGIDPESPDAFVDGLKRRLRNLKKRPYHMVHDNLKATYNFLGSLGFTDCIMGSTIYGDWSCTVWDMDSEKILGQFCADGGMYCVMYLNEVLKYAPAFDTHIIAPHAAAVIHDFKGDITPEVVRTPFVDSYGKDAVDESVVINGKGNINFTTAQTGF